MSSTPNSLATVSLITQMSGGVASAAGSYFGAKSQASGFDYQGQMAGLNAQLSELSAQHELDRGNQQIGALTLQAGQLKAKQRAALAANGVDLGVGSAAEMQATTDLMKEVDMNQLRANAIRSAWGHRVEGSNYMAQAAASKASAASISPGSAAVSSLLGSAGGVANSWYQLKKEGAIGGSGSARGRSTGGVFAAGGGAKTASKAGRSVGGAARLSKGGALVSSTIVKGRK